jgi:hypothetical protein
LISTAIAYSKSKLDYDQAIAVLACTQVFRSFWQVPSKEEAWVWGSHLKEHDPTNGTIEKLVQPLTITDSFNIIFGNYPKECWWLFAQDKITTPINRFIFLICKQIRNRLNNLKILLGKYKSYFSFPSAIT